MSARCYIFLAIFFCSSPLFAATTAEYHLDNGLTLIVREDHRAPIVVSSIWYKVGGSNEYSGITGISHVMEHMMFRGTQKYGPGVIDQMISGNGGEQNAMTTNDFTVYYQILSSDKLPLSFDIESDRMHNLLLGSSEFAREIQVVMEERRMRFDDNPQSVTFERFMAAAHVNSPYHHQAIGWMPDLQQMTIQDVRAWYKQWYAPNNAIIVIAGDVQADQVFALVKQYFGNITPITLPTVKARTEIPAIGVKTVHVYQPAKLSYLLEGYPTPSLTTTKNPSECYALDVLTAILSQGSSGRLTRDLIRDQQIVTEASAYYDEFSRYADQFILEAVPAPQHTIPEVKKALALEIHRLQTEPVNPEELTKIKTQVIAAKIYEKDSLMSQVMSIGSLAAIGLPWNLSDNYVTAIEAVTPEQIQAVAKKYLISEHLTVAILHPNASTAGVH